MSVSKRLGQLVLERLGVLAVTVAVGCSGSTEELTCIPESDLSDLLESDELDELDAEGRARIIQLLAGDPRATIRSRAVRHLPVAALPLSPEIQILLERLASDPDPAVANAFLDEVGPLFQGMTALERTRLVALWTTSDDSHLRRAAARALRTDFLALGVPSALDVLCADPNDHVRNEAALAARARGVA